MENIEDAVAIEGLKEMVAAARKAAEMIKGYDDTIRVISHYDADGITSAAIISLALKRLGKKFHLSIFRQLEEEFIKGLEKEKYSLNIITDMGSGQLDNLQKYLPDSKIIICDHHQIQGEIKREGIIHINSLELGMGENLSGSGVSYILARALDNNNIDLSELAIIGAIGDSQIDSVGDNWGLNGMNREILKDAQNSGKIALLKGLRIWGRYTRPLHKALEYTTDPFIPGITGSESKSIAFLNDMMINLKREDGSWRTISDLSEDEQKNLASGIIVARINGKHDNPEEIFGDVYELLERNEEFRDANEFATMLNSCGKTGKPDLGVRLCMNDESVFDDVRSAIISYKRSISNSVRWVQKQIKQRTDKVIFSNAVYVMAGEKIPQDIISNVMSIINHSHMVPDGKPLIGFASEDSTIKVSARLDKSLSGGPINLKEIISKASAACGGEGGGHAGASGARIPKDMEKRFMEIVEDELTNLNITDTINESTISSCNGETDNNKIIEDGFSAEKDL
ncbi:MAG: DHH family phosphoesterase [Candidatus Aenigmarchaeota archaeon]|nr:DHH family phosphoesterase [Candidatus Aenigmarchaeota archaeon]